CKKGTLHVHTPWTFPLDLNQIGTAGSKSPYDAAAARAAAHFLGKHGIDSATNSRISAGGIAATKGLVSFIDKNIATAQRVDEAKDLFEVSLAAANPLVPEILHFHDGDGGFTSEALDQESFPGTHGTAKKVALWQRGKVRSGRASSKC